MQKKYKKNFIQKSSRRSFLKGLIVFLNSLIALALTIPGLGYILTPVLRKDEQTWIKIGRTGSVRVGTFAKTIFRYVNSSGYVRTEKSAFVWMKREENGDITAFSPKCTHLGCNVFWNVADRHFECPCHGGIYDEHGNVTAGPPPRSLVRYLTKVENENIYIMSDRKHE